MITWKFFKYLYLYLTHCRIFKKICNEENLMQNLSELFHIQFRMDWVGRVYAVFNPITQTKQEEKIVELGQQGINMDDFVKNWIMERMVATDQFMTNKGVFELVTYDIEKIDDSYNYLFTIIPLYLKEFLEYTRKFAIVVSILLLIALTLLIIL